MKYVLIRHKVADFAKWKASYDGHVAARQQAGLTEKLLLRNANNPSEVVILFQAEDFARAREFAGSPDLQARMKQAGVLDKPNICFLE